LKCSRPVVIQMAKGEIFFKDENSESFTKYEKSQYFDETFERVMKRRQTCNLQTLLDDLISRLNQEFDVNLLNLLVDINVVTLLAKLSVKHNLLCFRFLQLFLKTSENFDDSVPIIDTLDYDGIGTLLAHLELPFEDSLPFDLKLNGKQSLKLRKPHEYNFNLLLDRAVKRTNIPALKFLLARGGIDVSQQQAYAKLSWESNLHECLLLLIKFDSPLPDNFYLDQVTNIADEFREILDEREVFFAAIELGAEDEVTEFIEQNRHLKVVYDANNKSAMRHALESNQLVTCAKLRSLGFSTGIDDVNFKKALNQLSDEQKAEMRNANRMYFAAIDGSHIHHLMAKSRFGSVVKDRETYTKMVKLMYEEIDETKIGNLILRFIGEIEQIEIAFDFIHEHVKDMDPTVTEETVGCVYRKSGYMMISMKRKKEEVLSTVCHEAMHYVMQTVYDNEGKPFHADDTAAKDEFSKILKNLEYYKNTPGAEEIIKNVFTCYSPELWPEEMIVRVAELEVFYKNSSIE
jgi:hypothetical protein